MKSKFIESNEKKMRKRQKQQRMNITNCSIINLTPHFAKTMLSVVFFNRQAKNLQ